LTFYEYVSNPNLYLDTFGLITENSVYVLKKGDKIVYVGIGNPDQRFNAHNNNPDKTGKFDKMQVIAEYNDRRSARNLEGSLLNRMGNKNSPLYNRNLLNARRKDGGYWHSYPDIPASPRKLLSDAELTVTLTHDPIKTKKAKAH